MKKFRILVADDHEVVRQGLRALLDAHRGWRVCGEAATGLEAVERAKELKPDVVVLDISMPGLDGLEATKRIRKILPQTDILVLTMHEPEEVLHEILDAGARSYVLKADGSRELIAALVALEAKKPFFSSAVLESVMEGYSPRGEGLDEEGPTHKSLTSREREVLRLLARGKSNKEIAAILGISPRTAETHRTNLMRKLGIHSVADLVRYAIRNKLIQP